jgi:hypothetical protein
MNFSRVSSISTNHALAHCRRNFGWCGVILVVLIGFTQQMLHAQTDTARITGSVTDSTGAVIPNAAVIVTNLEQGAAYNAVSDATGNFTVAALPRGTYNVSVTAKGFQGESEGVTLDVSQVQAINFKLTPGTVATTVTVTVATGSIPGYIRRSIFPAILPFAMYFCTASR